MRAKLIAVIIVAFAAGAALALAIQPDMMRIFFTGGAGAQAVRSMGKARIGGPFSLVDHTRRRVTEKDFRGRYMLIYFGYTFCPDICPAELQVISAALDALGSLGERITPVFVTIDPERDTVEQMASYVSNFHPRLVGLTGTPAETRAAAKTWRVYYAKAKDSASRTDYTYTMDHSSITYLMGPDGAFVTHFAYGTSVKAMAKRLRQILGGAGS